MLTKLRLLAALFTTVVVCALAMTVSASASNSMLLGLFDDGVTLDPATNSFPLLSALHVQVVRMTLSWGGPGGVGNKRPADPADPSDPAYDWARYDQALERANDAGIQLLLTIVGTPAWANGGKSPQHPPTSADDLRAFSYAAAQRYSGTFLDTASGRVLPRVGLWLAWARRRCGMASRVGMRRLAEASLAPPEDFEISSSPSSCARRHRHRRRRRSTWWSASAPWRGPRPRRAACGSGARDPSSSSRAAC